MMKIVTMMIMIKIINDNMPTVIMTAKMMMMIHSGQTDEMLGHRGLP